MKNSENSNPTNFYEFLNLQAERNPDKKIYSYLGKKFTNQQILNLTDILADSLHEFGLVKGDRIAIMLPNVIQFPVVFFACQKMGYVLSPVNPLLSAPEISHIINIGKPRIFIFLDIFTEKINKLKIGYKLEKYVATSITEFASFKIKVLFPLSQIHKKKVRFNRVDNFGMLDDFLKPQPVIHKKTETNSGDTTILLCTGGTTGTSKLAALSYGNLWSNAKQIAEIVPHIQENENVIAVLPLFHSFGLTICMNVSLLKKAHVVLVPKFSSKTVTSLINKHKATILPGVPIMFAALSKYLVKTRKKIPTLRDCFSGGTELLPEIKADFEKYTNAKITEAYGLTEASPAVSSNPVFGIQKPHSIGIPLVGTEVKIVDENLENLEPNKIGEIIVKGPQVMNGYWQNEPETKLALNEGWLFTGDLGYKDEDGYIFLTGRKKDMITHCGFKIYPQEVEKVLLEHPEISESGVCAIPDGYKGESVKAVIVAKNNSDLTEKKVIEHCMQQLAPFKVPKKVIFTNSLPKSFLGKVIRRQLNEIP